MTDFDKRHVDPNGLGNPEGNGPTLSTSGTDAESPSRDVRLDVLDIPLCVGPQRTTAKIAYASPAITSLTEADILQALGPARMGGYDNPFAPDGTNGLGGV